MSGSDRSRPNDAKLKYEVMGATDDEIRRLNYLDGVRKTIVNSVDLQPVSDEKPSVIIDDFLYHGDLGHACSIHILFEMGINAIVNVCDCQIDDDVNHNLDVLWKPIDDAFYVDIRGIFDEVIAFIEKCKSNKKKVLVHCQMGISRSGAVVLAYLMKTRNISLEDSLKFLIPRRSVVKPNPGFLLQLIRFEKELREKSSISQNMQETDGEVDCNNDKAARNQHKINQISSDDQLTSQGIVHDNMETEQTEVDPINTEEVKNENVTNVVSSPALSEDQLSELKSAMCEPETPQQSTTAPLMPETTITDEVSSEF